MRAVERAAKRAAAIAEATEPPKPTAHERIRAIKKIGPIFPAAEEGWRPGMRGVPRRSTLPPIDDGYRAGRRRRKRLASASRAVNR